MEEIGPKSSATSCIRFRWSEDRLEDELHRRRKLCKVVGALHCPCDKCGRYSYVIPDPTTRTAECERCWAIRRYKELIEEV